MDWKQLLAYIAGAVDKKLLLRNAYLSYRWKVVRGDYSPGRSHQRA
jgi:hypothetical protein